jgi:hypothetical protein
MDQYAALYLTLRGALIGPHRVDVPGDPTPYAVAGHFLSNGRFPVDLFQEYSDLYDSRVAPPPGPTAGGDNPLMNTGKLLIPLTVEARIGSAVAPALIDAALTSLTSLFPFSGEFAGCPMRADPVTAPNWTAGYSADFLLDDKGGYTLPAPLHDWRRSRRISQAEFASLTEDDRRAWSERHRLKDMGPFRSSEPSSDELCGLLTGLFLLWQSADGNRRATAGTLLGRLGDYLAGHSYFLVRPTGGFSARGPATGSVAGEFAAQRIFARALGDPHAARHSVPTVLASAGLWPGLESAWNTWSVIGAGLWPVLEPVLGVALAGIGLAQGSGTELLEFLVANGADITVLGGAYALGLNQLMFDCETRISDDQKSVDEEYPLEIALATALSAVDARTRLQMYLTVWGTLATRGWAVGFLPFLGLSALDDTDPTVRRAYLTMYDARVTKGLGWGSWRSNNAPRDAFPTAVALLLAADDNATSARVGMLEARLAAQLTCFAGYFRLLGGPPVTLAGLSEDANPALEYQAALALAWLHRLRQQGRNVAVGTAGFPVPPAAGDLDATTYQIVPKPPVPAPVLPPLPGQPFLETITVQVGPLDGVVAAGMVVHPLDEVEIEASGTVMSGELFDHPSGPDGWPDVPDSTDYPMTGPDSRKYALVGRLGRFGAAFTVGSAYARRRFRYDRAEPLELTINTWNHAKGSGRFVVTVRRWSGVPAEGSLVKTAGDPTVYLIRHGAKSLVQTPDVLLVILGRTWAEVQVVADPSVVAAIPDGPPLMPFWGPGRFWTGDFAGGRFLAAGDTDFRYWLGTFTAGAYAWSAVQAPADLDMNGLSWTGDFTGAGHDQLLTYISDQWLLVDFGAGPEMTVAPVGNTAGFGNLADRRPMWAGDFTGTGVASMLFYYPGDGKWWLGTVVNGQLGWTSIGNTTAFGNLADGRPLWTGAFGAPGHDQVLFYFPGDGNWWLGTPAATSLTWVNVGNTGGFGNLADGRPMWAGDFTGTGVASMLFYYPGNRTWTLGTLAGGVLGWAALGNTTGFGDIADGRPVWTGAFSTPGHDQVLFYFPGDGNWWLGTPGAAGLAWAYVGNTTGFGNLADGRPVWTADFTGSGTTDVLFYYPGDYTWWLGSMTDGCLTWREIAEGVKLIVQGPT